MGEAMLGGWGAEGGWEICVPSSHFCCEPKTAVKKFIYKGNQDMA